jgi:hypothetical protein
VRCKVLSSLVLARSVADGEGMHFVGCERFGDCMHLFIDVVLTNVFGERRELLFDTVGLLAFKRRGVDF